MAEKWGCVFRIFRISCALVLVGACTSAAEEPTTSQPELPASSVAVTTTQPDVNTTADAAVTTTTLRETTTTLQTGEPVLLAHYPLDGDAQNAVEPSGKWDGAVFGAVPTTDRFGSADSAMFFDGIDDHVDVSIGGGIEAGASRLVALEPDLNTQAITIAAWVLADSEPRDLDLWWDVVSYGWDDHVLGIHGEGGLVAGLQGNAFCAFISEGYVLDGQWHHIAMTRDKTGLTTVYLDGAQQDVAPQTAMDRTYAPSIVCPDKALTSPSMWIGSDLDFEEYFEGAIDDVRIYNDALTAEEVLALYALK